MLHREAIYVSMYERSGQKSQHQRCPLTFMGKGEYIRQIHPNVQFARSPSTFLFCIQFNQICDNALEKVRLFLFGIA